MNYANSSILSLTLVLVSTPLQSKVFKASRVQVRDSVVGHYLPIQEKTLKVQENILAFAKNRLIEAQEILDQSSNGFLASASLEQLKQREAMLQRAEDELDRMAQTIMHMDKEITQPRLTNTLEQSASKQSKDVVKIKEEIRDIISKERFLCQISIELFLLVT